MKIHQNIELPKYKRGTLTKMRYAYFAYKKGYKKIKMSYKKHNFKSQEKYKNKLISQGYTIKFYIYKDPFICNSTKKIKNLDKYIYMKTMTLNMYQLN